MADREYLASNRTARAAARGRPAWPCAAHGRHLLRHPPGAQWGSSASTRLAHGLLVVRRWRWTHRDACTPPGGATPSAGGSASRALGHRQPTVRPPGGRLARSTREQEDTDQVTCWSKRRVGSAAVVTRRLRIEPPCRVLDCAPSIPSPEHVVDQGTPAPLSCIERELAGRRVFQHPRSRAASGPRSGPGPPRVPRVASLAAGADRLPRPAASAVGGGANLLVAGT